jgi:murein DD-endopeptidase MepM/ murein hydrolase activator NlpD
MAVKINQNNAWSDDLSGTLLTVSANVSDNNYYKNYTIVGYARDPDHKLPVVFRNADESIFWYDGHNGYDYVVSSSENVIAASSGYIIPSECDPCYNTVCIYHGNGYRTYYLHLSEISSALMENGVIQPVWVEAKQFLGHPGNVDCKAKVGIHLHFEVKRSINCDKWIPVDPYGSYTENGDNFEPELWISGQ